MSGEVDDRIVSMVFDNERFEKNIADTLQSLDRLTEALQFQGAQDGLEGLSNEMQGFDASGMASAIDTINEKLSAMGAIGFAVIENLTTAAINFVRNTGADILTPILTGGKKRAVNIDNAKFAFEGLGLDVQTMMDAALAAVKGTAYGLDEAAKATAQFGASGITASDKITQALRGIAGAAAMTNSSFSEIADIFTSSAATGVVNNQDLLQFATRGLNASATLAKAMGITEAQVHELARDGKISFAQFSEVMDNAFGAHAQEANKTYEGSLANMHAAMSRLGAAFQTPFLKNQQNLFNALSPAIDNAAKALNPIQQTFTWFSTLKYNSIIDFINALDFTKIQQPLQNVAEGIANIIYAIKLITNPIKAAFKEMFPVDLAGGLLKFSEVFKNFTEQLKIGGPTAEKIKRTFKGVFAILDIGIHIVGAIVGMFVNLFKSIHPAGGGILDFTAHTGDLLVKLDEFLIKGGKLNEFFQKIGDYIGIAVAAVLNFKDKIVSFFKDVDLTPVADGVDVASNRISSRIENFKTLADKVIDAWDRFKVNLTGVFDVLDQVWEAIKTWFGELGSKIADAFKPGDFNNAVDLVNVGLLGGIAVLIKKFMDGDTLDLGTGLVEKIKGVFDGLTGTLDAMQTKLKAEALLKIAEAVGILVASVTILSLIDSVALTKALTAMSVGFAQLIATMTVMDKLIGSKDAAAKLTILAAAMIEISIAMGLLSIAIANLGRLKMGDLAKGLIGVSVGLSALVLATKFLPTDVSGLLRASVAMSLIAVAMIALSHAVKDFADIPAGDVAKGLAAIAAGLVVLIPPLKEMPPSSVLSGIGLIEMAAGLRLLAIAVQAFGSMDLKTIGVGLAAIAGAFIVIVPAMEAMPKDLAVKAAGMIALGAALEIIAHVVKQMGEQDLGTIAKGLGALSVMLIALVIGLNAMDGALPGAAALIVAAGAIAILGDTLKQLGDLKISELLTGLAAIAAVIALVAVASIALAPLAPALLVLGGVLAVVGAAFALFGAGMYLLAVAFEKFGQAGENGTKGLVAMLKAIITMIPDILSALITAVKKALTDFLDAVPLFIRLLEAVLSQLLETIIKLTPKIVIAFIVIGKGILLALRELGPDLIETGFQLVMALLQGISDHIEDIVTVVTDIIVKITDTLIQNVPRLVEAGTNLMVAFLTELGNHADELVTAGVGLIISIIQGIAENVSLLTQAVTNLIITILTSLATSEMQIVDAGFKLLVWLLQGIANNINYVVDSVTNIIVTFIQTLSNDAGLIIDAGFQLLISLLSGIGDNIVNVANTVGDIIVKFIEAIGQNAQRVADAGADTLVSFLDGLGKDITAMTRAGTDLAIKILEGAADNAVDFTNRAADVLINFLNGMAEAIRTHSKELRDAGMNIAGAIVDGITGGLASKAGDVANSLKDLAGDGLSAIGGALGIGGPSKKMIYVGEHMIEGLSIGLASHKPAVDSAVNLSNRVYDAIVETINKIPDDISGIDEFNPVITPVLDLTKIKTGARGLDTLLGAQSIAPDISISQARSISVDTAEQASTPADSSVPQITEVKYEQNIYSPKALSTNDIYRNSNSLFARAKEELGISETNKR